MMLTESSPSARCLKIQVVIGALTILTALISLTPVASQEASKLDESSGECSLLAARCPINDTARGPHHHLRPAKWIHGYFRESAALEIVDETADQRLANTVRLSYLTRSAYFFTNKFDSPLAGVQNWQLELLAADNKLVDEARCHRHLQQTLELMGQMKEILATRRDKWNVPSANFEEKHLRLAQLLDSFGRYEAGFLMGRTHTLGSYGQCKDSRLVLADGGNIKGRYCMANLDVSKFQHHSLRSKSEPAEDVISVGICLPESCHTKSFAANKPQLQALVDSQFQLPDAMFQEQHLPLESIFCELDPDSELARLPVSGKLLLLFVLVWLAAALYATSLGDTKALEWSSSVQIGQRLVLCLNLRDSWSEFLGKSDTTVLGASKSRVSLAMLNPVKVVGCMLVVLGHAVILSLIGAMDPIRAARESETDPWMFLIVGTSMIVDSFYVITGITVAFIVAGRLDKRIESHLERCAKTKTKTIDYHASGWFLKQCGSIIIARYLRLVPLYFLVFWFKKSLMPSLSSGPLWDHGYNLGTEAGSCRAESWLTPITFGAAYLPFSRQCLPQAWSVAGDLFFTFVLAPILVLMSFRPTLAALISLLISVASSISLSRAAFAMDSGYFDDLMEIRTIAIANFIKFHGYIYSAPHYRVFSILVGALAGYLLHHYNLAMDESHKLRHWPGWFTGKISRLAACFILADLGLPMAIPLVRNSGSLRQLLTFVPVGSFIYAETIGRLLWAISNAVIFLRLVTDWQDNFWLRDYSATFWSSMVKLNYAILLVHMDLLKFDSFVQLSTKYYSRYSMIKLFAATYFLALPISFILYVLFENPMKKIVKCIHRHLCKIDVCSAIRWERTNKRT